MTFNVLTAEFLHETNTFNVHKTDLPAFEANTLLSSDMGKLYLVLAGALGRDM